MTVAYAVASVGLGVSVSDVRLSTLVGAVLPRVLSAMTLYPVMPGVVPVKETRLVLYGVAETTSPGLGGTPQGLLTEVVVQGQQERPSVLEAQPDAPPRLFRHEHLRGSSPEKKIRPQSKGEGKVRKPCNERTKTNAFLSSSRLSAAHRLLAKGPRHVSADLRRFSLHRYCPRPRLPRSEAFGEKLLGGPLPR